MVAAIRVDVMMGGVGGDLWMGASFSLLFSTGPVCFLSALFRGMRGDVRGAGGFCALHVSADVAVGKASHTARRQKFSRSLLEVNDSEKTFHCFSDSNVFSDCKARKNSFFWSKLSTF